MIHSRVFACLAGAALALLAPAASQKLSAAEKTASAVVLYHASGTFSSKPVSGEDLLELEGNPFTIDVVGIPGTKPVKTNGKTYAYYTGLAMSGEFTSSYDPTSPYKVTSKAVSLTLEIGSSNDTLLLATKVKVVDEILTINATVDMPTGTLKNIGISPFANSVTLSTTDTLTYSGKNPEGKQASTTLSIASGTLTATYKKSSGTLAALEVPANNTPIGRYTGADWMWA